MLNLDTHILLFALQGTLKQKERSILEKHFWSISDIVLWEISKLQELGRIEIDLNDSEVRRVIAQIHIWPIDIEVSRAIQLLDFSADPADEIIAATSLVKKIPLITRDKIIKKSKKVSLVCL